MLKWHFHCITPAPSSSLRLATRTLRSLSRKQVSYPNAYAIADRGGLPIGSKGCTGMDKTRPVDGHMQSAWLGFPFFSPHPQPPRQRTAAAAMILYSRGTSTDSSILRSPMRIQRTPPRRPQNTHDPRIGMAGIWRRNDRNLGRRHQRGTENDDNGPLGGRGSRLAFACPFFKHRWKQHQYCVVPMRHVSDVRQHIKRSHQDEVSEGDFGRIGAQVNKTGSPQDRWYILWNILFPGEPQPDSPFYAGSPSVELAMCFINDFKRQESLRPDELETLEKLATFVTSTETASQGVSTPLRLGSPDVGESGDILQTRCNQERLTFVKVHHLQRLFFSLPVSPELRFGRRRMELRPLLTSAPAPLRVVSLGA